MHESIGLLGGSFNPIHEGHLAMAEAARRELALDRMIILPDGDPPHKSTELAGKRHRLRMAELAAAGRFEVSSMEIDRPGKTFTVDTLEVLHALYPQATIWLIIGADTLHELPNWKTAPRVFALCRFAVFARGKLPLTPVPGADVTRLETPIPPISATEIRGRVHRGQSLEGFTPRAVEDYIGAHRLYDPPVLMRDKDIRKRLKETLPPGRYRHTLGVEATMLQLAVRWGYRNLEKVTLTGLLHDCSKGMTLEEMRRFVDEQGMRMAATKRESTALLHGEASAAMARAVFGVTDPEILHAIRYHNTGCAPAGKLDEILWVADMMEPGRKEHEWMPAFRALADADLSAAARRTLRLKIDYTQSRGKEVHPDTALALAALEEDAQREAPE